MKTIISKRFFAMILALCLVSALFCGCGKTAEAIDLGMPVGEPEAFPEEIYLDETSEIFEFGFEEVPLAEAPAAIPTILLPSAPGTTVYGNQKAAIDASNAKDGYVMIKYKGTGTARLKVQITGPSGVSYTYNLNTAGDYEVFPLSDGNGSYKVGVYQNVSGTKYTSLYSKTFDVTLTDQFAPFLRPNQYVNYSDKSKVVSLAGDLVKDCKTELDKVAAIYHYVITNFTYDKEKAQTVKSGYLPVVDSVLEAKKGICFDYAAVMSAMLRSQGIPTKLVVGYTGDLYHAWINTYSSESGWIEGVIFFDGSTWKLMDPTFASSGNSSKAAMEYIGNSSNYSAKYLY